MQKQINNETRQFMHRTLDLARFLTYLSTQKQMIIPSTFAINSSILTRLAPASNVCSSGVNNLQEAKFGGSRRGGETARTS